MKDIERKTVFLYPPLSDLGYKQLANTNSLISSMNLIVRSANELILSILKAEASLSLVMYHQFC